MAGRWVLGLSLCAVASAHAQDAQRVVPCRGQRVDSITVDAQAPTVSGLRRVPLIGNIARETHVITRPDVVRRSLLLRVGDRCSELRRAESERILRAQPYIADATVDAIANDRGGVTLEVRTIDETSVILSAAVSGEAPVVRGMRVGSGNLAGLGIHTSVSWRYKPYYDDRRELRLMDYQFAGRPYVLALASRRDPLGRDDHGSLTLPFRTDLQRIAWRAMIGESRSHATFAERDSGLLALGYQREYAEAGGIARVGPPGRLSLLGLSLTNERAIPDTFAGRLTERGLQTDTANGFAGRFMETRAARVNLLLGVRSLRFVRARGLDALRGTQDIAMGLQFGTLVGRGVELLGADSRDVFVASDLYLGFGNSRRTFRLQLQGEGRRARGAPEWDGLVGTGRFAHHARLSERRTRIIALEWSGTSRVLVPHALSLGIPDGGLRGYRRMELVGGRRAIARVDERWFLGTPFDFGDLGMSLFVEGGQQWAGDVPYGTSTRLLTSTGASLQLAVPRRSTRTWRLEYMMPMNHAPGIRRWELRLTHRDLTSFLWSEPRDVDAARARTVPASIYAWP